VAGQSKSDITVSTVLDSSTESLDSNTAIKLRRIRQQALAQSPQRVARWWIPMGAISATAAAALVATLMTTTLAPQAHVDTIEDIDILASSDSTDLYEQVDFYEWLDSQQGNKGSNAG